MFVAGFFAHWLKKICKIFDLEIVLDKWRSIFFGANVEIDDIEDNELVNLAKKDLNYFSALFNRFFDKVYKFFYFRLQAREEAEDLTSDTFEKIFQSLDKFDDSQGSFSSWIYTVAHNKLIDYYRKQKNKKTSSFEDLLPAEEPKKDFDLKSIDQKIIQQHLNKAIKVLPKKQQAMWALKLTEDLSHKEIAKTLNTTEANINVMIHRSISTLKKQLAYLVNEQ